MSDKSLPPSPQKLREARRRGQVPRSKLLGASGAVAGGLVGTFATATSSRGRVGDWTIRLLSLDPVPSAAEALQEGLGVLLSCAAAPLGGAFVGALVCAAMTSGGLEVNFGLVAPRLDRCDVAEGLKRLWSWRQVGDIAKGLVVTAAVGWVLWNGLAALAPSALRAISSDALVLGEVISAFAPTVLKASALLLALGAVDYGLARRRHLKDLMMSPDEMKREHKNSEGDPQAKSKRKSMHRQLAQGGPGRGVRVATAVVVNPTHVAVALRYEQSECDAPYIVAKGREGDALSIRREAQALGVPVVRDVALARTLVHYDVGEVVPEELYRAAAAVLTLALEKRPDLLTPQEDSTR